MENFVYYAYKVRKGENGRRTFIGIYSSLEAFKENLKKVSCDKYYAVSTGQETRREYYSARYEDVYIVVEKIKINNYDPLLEEFWFNRYG